MKMRCKTCGRYRRLTGCVDHGWIGAIPRWLRKRAMRRRIDRNIQMLFQWKESGA